MLATLRSKLPGWFLELPAGKQLLAEEAAHAATARAALVDERVTLLAARSTEVQAMDEALAAAGRKAEAAREKWRALAVAAHDVAEAQWNATHRFDRARRVLERDLVVTADPAIDAFIAELNAVREDRSWQNDLYRAPAAPRSVAERREALEARLRAFIEILNRAEALKVIADVDVPAGIAGLRAEVATLLAPGSTSSWAATARGKVAAAATALTGQGADS